MSMSKQLRLLVIFLVTHCVLLEKRRKPSKPTVCIVVMSSDFLNINIFYIKRIS